MSACRARVEPHAQNHVENCHVDDFIDLINGTTWSHYDLQRVEVLRGDQTGVGAPDNV